jgi:hypothetical protein
MKVIERFTAHLLAFDVVKTLLGFTISQIAIEMKIAKKKVSLK